MANSTTNRSLLPRFCLRGSGPPTAFRLRRFFLPLLDRDPHHRLTALCGLVTAWLGPTIFAIATVARIMEPAGAIAKSPSAEQAGPALKMDISKIYNTNCVACHGVDGTGDLVRNKMPTIPNFASLSWQVSHTDIEITHQIEEGEDPLMPGYRDKLSKQQILGVAIYIRAFAVHPTAPIGRGPERRPPTPIASRMTRVQIYRAFCLACHDADGRGETVREGMPAIPDFTTPKWQDSRTDADLRQSVLDGKGKFMLPMSDKVDEAEAGQMVAYVRAFRGRKQVVALEPQKPLSVQGPSRTAIVSEPKAPIPPPGLTARSAELAPRLRAATVLYRQYCVICHMLDGRGTAMSASMPSIPNFTKRAWQVRRTDEQLLLNVLDGTEELMPSFRSRLSTQQARDLIAYVRAFGPPERKRAEAPASDFEKRFQELQDQWEELEKQLHKLSPPTQQP